METFIKDLQKWLTLHPEANNLPVVDHKGNRFTKAEIKEVNGKFVVQLIAV